MWEHRHNRNLSCKGCGSGHAAEWAMIVRLSEYVMDVSSSRVGEERSTSLCWCFLSSLPPVHPVLVSLRSALEPACMWGWFCHFLSIGPDPPPHTYTHGNTSSHLQTALHNSMRISGLTEVYSLFCAATFFSHSPFWFPYIFRLLHTRACMHTFIVFPCHMLNMHLLSQTTQTVV